jgi:hypothetical protein
MSEQTKDAAVADWKQRHECDELGLKVNDGAVMCFMEGYEAAAEIAATELAELRERARAADEVVDHYADEQFWERSEKGYMNLYSGWWEGFRKAREYRNAFPKEVKGDE